MSFCMFGRMTKYIFYKNNNTFPFPLFLAGQKQNEPRKLTVHYTASQHYQENVFIEGSRPQYLEELHTEAQEGLKILQQEGEPYAHLLLHKTLINDNLNALLTIWPFNVRLCFLMHLTQSFFHAENKNGVDFQDDQTVVSLQRLYINIHGNFHKYGIL